MIADIYMKVALWELISEERMIPTRYTYPSTLNPILLQLFNRILQISSSLRAQLYHCLINRDIFQYWIDKGLIPSNAKPREIEI